jgi:hypothetical protein
LGGLRNLSSDAAGDGSLDRRPLAAYSPGV